MKKILFMFLAIAIAIAPCSYATNSTDDSTATNSTVATFNHTEYQYDYSKRGTGTMVKVTNLSSGTTDEVFVTESTVYLNDKKIGTISEEDSSEIAISNSTALAKKGSVWKKCGSKTKRITWAKGTKTAIIAAVIGAALGGAATGRMIFAAMGAAALSTLAAQRTGGKISYTLYKSKVGKYMRYKWVWKFKASTGDSYGPYKSYATV